MAAVMVVVHHAASLNGPQTARAIAVPAAVMDGGVAVFFVLSGFLIYRPFAVAHRVGTPAPRVLGFWWRRLLRLIPAYWAALTILWLSGAFELGGAWWRYYLFIQPYTAATALGGLVQAWSLATEVSFYLFVPIWAAAVRGMCPRRMRTARADLLGCVGLYAAGFGVRALISWANPSWRGLSFQWLPTNIDLFAVGMALAIASVGAADGARWTLLAKRLARRTDLWWATGLALFSGYAIVVGPPDLAQLGDPNGAYRGWFWQRRQLVLGLFTALLLMPAVFGDQDRGAAHWLLRVRPVAWLGTVSYGVYLWHFDWMKQSIPPFAGPSIGVGTGGFWYLLAVGLVLGAISAALSWRILESPMQRFRSIVQPRGGESIGSAPSG